MHEINAPKQALRSATPGRLFLPTALHEVSTSHVQHAGIFLNQPFQPVADLAVGQIAFVAFKAFGKVPSSTIDERFIDLASTR
jgi:hypothetical protein